MQNQTPEKTKKEEMYEIELSIGKALRVGVVLATIVMIIGLALLLINGGNTGYPTGVIPVKPMQIASGVIALKPFAIMMFGLLLLILTPVLRVIVSIYAFAVEKDYLYVWITSIVLLILVISMIIGYLSN